MHNGLFKGIYFLRMDTSSFLIPLATKNALIVSDTDWGLEEMEGLLTTLGVSSTQKLKIIVESGRQKIDPGTYIRAGKLEEITQILENEKLDLLVADFDLSPSQMKNIQKTVKKMVFDRSGVILEIFSRHAKSKEAKLQVELARLEYLMPRLTNMWDHFERQKGAGGAALKGKGMGEKQIEVDRRLVKDRIHFIKKKLKDVEEARQLHRKHRDQILKVALVGYTNAGKSTLLNSLTHANALAKDALFATLDAQIKQLNPKLRPTILAIDTVGFIDRLPHSLVASFRSTLSEVLEADLLLHVLDASHPEYKRQFEVTMEVLTELDASKIPMFLVLNKMDRVKTGEAMTSIKLWQASVTRKANETKIVGSLQVSAFDSKSVEALREKVMQYFEKDMQVYEIIVPFDDGKLIAKLHEFGIAVHKKNTEKGMFYTVKTLPEFAAQMNLEKYKI